MYWTEYDYVNGQKPRRIGRCIWICNVRVYRIRNFRWHLAWSTSWRRWNLLLRWNGVGHWRFRGIWRRYRPRSDWRPLLRFELAQQKKFHWNKEWRMSRDELCGLLVDCRSLVRRDLRTRGDRRRGESVHIDSRWPSCMQHSWVRKCLCDCCVTRRGGRKTDDSLLLRGRLCRSRRRRASKSRWREHCDFDIALRGGVYVVQELVALRKLLLHRGACGTVSPWMRWLWTQVPCFWPQLDSAWPGRFCGRWDPRKQLLRRAQ